MSCYGLQERWKSEEYKNYLKVIEALLYLRDGLGPFCEHIMTDFQSEILEKHKIAHKECTKKTCIAKNITKGKLQPECSDICSVLLTDILDEHRSCKNPKAVYWDNSQIRKWSVDAWEIAKIYMGRGQKMDNNCPQKSDSAAIFQLLSNCKRFWKHTPCKEVEKLSNRRNAAMHSSTLSCARDDMQEAVTMMIDFLKRLIQKLSAGKDIEAIKKTIGKLIELKDTEFEIFLKNNEKTPDVEEMKIFHEIITDHENRLNNLEELKEKVEEIKTVIPLLEMMQRNPDLMAHLEDGYQNLISLSQLEERTSALTEMTEATASRVADVEEDLADLWKQLEALALASPDKNRSQVTNYKGQLKNFLDSKRISVHPKYKPWPDPTSNNKWLASVTIILGSETKTFESPSSCQRIIDAEHSAAWEAYQFLTKHEELFTASDTLTAGEDPREKLDKLLESFGFAKATYRDCGDKFTGIVKNFKASVMVNVSDIIQKKLDDPNMKQADREQAVALEALKAIGQEVAGSAKNTLHGWCGRNKHTVPKYYPESPKELMNYIHVVSSAFREKHEVEIEGNWCPNKKDAKRSAAELLLRMIEETQLKDVWRSTCQSNSDSVSTAAVRLSQPSDKHCIEAKAEAKASENSTMPTRVDSSSYCDELRRLCEKLVLDPPEFKVVTTKENLFQANVTMEYIFQPEEGLQSKSKAEAENKAAQTALTVLLTDKISEQDKNYKSLLNEFCQKQGIKNHKPDYMTTGSGTNFHSKVKVKFVQSCSEVFQTESEARDFSARKVLQKLGQNKNHFEILKKLCADDGLEVPKIDYKSSPDGGEAFCAVLNMTYVFDSETPHQTKKDAEKNAACHALKVLYPDIDCSDLNKCKNLLQEQTPSTPPTYNAEKLENGKFTGKATVWFQMQGNSSHSNKEDALNEVAQKFLGKINLL